MATDLGYYNPVFYSQEAIMQMEKRLGLARAVYRGYDTERRVGLNKGDTINIRLPQTFSASDAPAAAVEIKTGTTQLVLNKWREVKFKLTDKDLTLAKEVIIRDHIRPMAYALVDDIEQSIAALFKQSPWFFDVGSTAGIADIVGPRKILLDNKVPLTPGDIAFAIDTDMEADFLTQAAFSQWQGSGDKGVATQESGYLGRKFGADFFATQNIASHVKGTLSSTTPLLKGAGVVGSKSIILDAGTLTGTLKAGDTFVLAGDSQRYVVTADATAASNEIAISIEPGLTIAYADNAQATVRLDDHVASCIFHRNAFALAMAPMDETGKELGAKIATVTDPETGISVRSRVYYIGNSSEVHVAMDCLWGVKVLDYNKSVRACN